MKKNIFLLVVLTLNGCITYDPPKKSLEIYNYSDEAIYVYISRTDSLQLTPKLVMFYNIPDMGFDENNVRLDSLVTPDYRINAHNYSYLRESSTSSTKWIPFKDKDYVVFFFIRESTIKKFSWEEICNKQLYEKKVKYSYKELEKLHYRILYKP
jgi:hypothetical protein